MKILSSFALGIICCTLFFSCQKVLEFETGFASAGSLSKDNAGNCLPVTINGIYKVNTQLNSSHYIDVSVNVTTTGSYEIYTDTINGIHFGDSASFTATGLQVVRLKGYGTPVSSGPFSFTAHYNNSSSCLVAITVSPAGSSAATFTLAGAPGACVSPQLLGSYIAGTILNASNKLIVSVDVSIIGDYTLTAAAVNGISFSGAGTFTMTGPQTVTLSGSGTPLTAGTNLMAITGTAAGCSFPVTVAPAGGSSGTKLKRIIQSVTGTRQAYITTLTYDAGDRLLTFKEWEEDSAFTPIKISGANYSAFTYLGTGQFPIKNTITDETTRVDSTLYTYDGLNRVIKEDYYSNGQVSVRNNYSYLSSTIVLLGKYVLSSPGPALNFRGNDSLIFDAQNRITESRSYDPSNVYNGYSTYQYDNKNNPFALIRLFSYAFTLYCDDAKYFYRAPNNFTNFTYANLPSAPETITVNYNSYNAASYPLTGSGSINNGTTIQNFTLRYEYY